MFFLISVFILCLRAKSSTQASADCDSGPPFRSYSREGGREERGGGVCVCVCVCDKRC